jgi:hypothetical protein
VFIWCWVSWLNAASGAWLFASAFWLADSSAASWDVGFLGVIVFIGDARWHEAVARATKNRLRIGISLGLHEPVLRQLPALSAGVDRYSRSIPRALAKITKAIADDDADGARDAMRAHIEQWNRLNRDIPGADAA